MRGARTFKMILDLQRSEFEGMAQEKMVVMCAHDEEVPRILSLLASRGLDRVRVLGPQKEESQRSTVAILDDLVKDVIHQHEVDSKQIPVEVMNRAARRLKARRKRWMS